MTIGHLIGFMLCIWLFLAYLVIEGTTERCTASTETCFTELR